MVVFFHLNGQLLFENQLIIHSSYLYNLIYNFFNNGYKGVQLFFAISGFIITLPFAKHFIKKEKPVSIKNYFLRRLTRIEPPYIITMLVCFAFIILKNNYTFLQLWPSLFSALFYFNQNFLIGPTLNGVAWSLEIEVQFYIMAPLICYIFILNKVLRRVLLLSIIILMPVVQFFYPFHFRTIYDFIQYFLVGILIADLYISNFKIILPKFLGIILGAFIFILMIYINGFLVVGKIVLSLSILSFFFLVLNNEFYKKIFSIKYITVIGGMCYSIYLWHYIIISIVLNRSVFIKVSNDYLVNLIFQSFLILPCILLFSVIFYLLIERPCMNKNWTRDLASFLKKKFIK
jgi:peptidoglycan/LPS O-acetylase OafA/YrhL